MGSEMCIRDSTTITTTSTTTSSTTTTSTTTSTTTPTTSIANLLTLRETRLDL